MALQQLMDEGEGGGDYEDLAESSESDEDWHAPENVVLLEITLKCESCIRRVAPEAAEVAPVMTMAVVVQAGLIPNLAVKKMIRRNHHQLRYLLKL